jgi:hypothetical protein
VGNLLGALLATRLVRRAGLGATLIGASIANGLIGFLLPLAGGPPVAAAAFLVAGQLFGDMAQTIFDIHAVSLRQAITPDQLLGRTNASMQLLEAGLGPIGALVGGVLGQIAGVREAIFISALGRFLAFLWLVFSPVRRLDGAGIAELPPQQCLPVYYLVGPLDKPVFGRPSFMDEDHLDPQGDRPQLEAAGIGGGRLVVIEGAIMIQAQALGPPKAQHCAA